MNDFEDRPRSSERGRRDDRSRPDNRRPYGSFNNNRFRRDFGPRTMHKAVCDECKQECEVPFKPIKDKPVYCKECFNKRNNRN